MTVSNLKSAIIFLVISASCFSTCQSDADEIENVLLITMDGLRWQELFYGAEERLIDKEAGKVEDVKLTRQKYWHDDLITRRELLMPNFWNIINEQGQIFGSPDNQSKVTVTNQQYFSYPGYNELLCGFPDAKIDSNDKNYNQNVTVLEWLNQKEEYKGRVAAFCSWDVFPYIINDKRSGVYVNAGWQPLEFFEDESTKSAFNQFHRQLPRYWQNVRYDIFTFQGAFEYAKVKKPKVLYVALGETDDWAHAGRYDLYLDSAKTNDMYIFKLWQLIQSSDQYRNKTALIVSTDHGRGDGKEGWKNHNDQWPGSDKIWIAVMGPGIEATGIRSDVNGTQSQIAPTVADLLGENFAGYKDSIAKPLPLIRQSVK